MNEEKGCQVHMVLGNKASEFLRVCGTRAKGLCCRDCSVSKKCKTRCSLVDEKVYGKCSFYMTDTEAVFRKIFKGG